MKKLTSKKNYLEIINSKKIKFKKNKSNSCLENRRFSETFSIKLDDEICGELEVRYLCTARELNSYLADIDWKIENNIGQKYIKYSLFLYEDESLLQKELCRNC